MRFAVVIVNYDQSVLWRRGPGDVTHFLRHRPAPCRRLAFPAV